MTTYSPELAIPEIAQNQNNKYITHNDAIKFCGQAANRTLVSATTGALTLTEDQFTRNLIFKPSGRAAAFNVVVPDAVNISNAERFFIVWNADTTYDATVKAVSAGTTVILHPGQVGFLYRNGVNVVALAVTDAGNGIYDIGVFISGLPGDGSTILKYVFVRAATFVGNWVGSKYHNGTNPSGTIVFDVKKNGSSIGSISVTSGGVATFTSTAGAAQSFAIGDRLHVVAPTPQDGTLADVSITFLGARA